MPRLASSHFTQKVPTYGAYLLGYDDEHDEFVAQAEDWFKPSN